MHRWFHGDLVRRWLRIAVLFGALAACGGGGGGPSGTATVPVPAATGRWQTFQYPGALWVSANGINNDGTIVGQYLDATSTSHGFIYSAGILHALDVPGATSTTPRGINSAGTIVGYYSLSNANPYQGFIYMRGTFITLNVPGARWTYPMGISDDGVVVGGYLDAQGREHGFRSFIGFTTIDAPNSIATVATGINASGVISGYFADATVAKFHGFTYAGGSFATIDAPGATGGNGTNNLGTFANGISDTGEVVGYYTTASGTRGFSYANGTLTSLDVPGTQVTIAYGVSPRGTIVGRYAGGTPFVYYGGACPMRVVPSTRESGASMYAEAFSADGLTIPQAAAACGFLHFTWQQQKWNEQCPSQVFPVVPSFVAPQNLCPLTGDLFADQANPLLDPVKGGHRVPAPAQPCTDCYPFFTSLSDVAAAETGPVCSALGICLITADNRLTFYDRPVGPWFDTSASRRPSQYNFKGFSTRLVGVSTQPRPGSQTCASDSTYHCTTIYAWTWNTTLNGNDVGGITILPDGLP